MRFTIGLQANNGERSALVKIQIERTQNGGAILTPVSGNNLARISGKVVTLTAEQYDDRPHDPYDNAKEAIWALKQCGWHAVAEEDEF